MKWRGQGILVAAVLAGAAALAHQWQSSLKLEDHVMSYGLDYGTSMNSVAEFVDRKKRWPEKGEIVFSSEPDDGFIKKAELLENGEILFTLTTWTIESGNVQAVFAPVLNTRAGKLGFRRLQYHCVEVDPGKYMHIVCRSDIKSTRSQVAAENADAFVKWQKAETEEQNRSAQFSSALALAQNMSNQCDRLWAKAEQESIPCLQSIDATLANQFAEQGRKQLNGLRLRPEVIVNNPKLVADFDRNCDDTWQMLVNMAKGANGDAVKCF